MLVIVISMMLSFMSSASWETPVKPAQLIAVGVMLGVVVCVGVLDGVNVKVAGVKLIGVPFEGVLP